LQALLKGEQHEYGPTFFTAPFSIPQPLVEPDVLQGLFFGTLAAQLQKLPQGGVIDVCKRHVLKTSLVFISCFILNIILVPPHLALAETWSKIDLGEYANDFKNVSENILNTTR
jgi:hypothetical protein